MSDEKKAPAPAPRDDKKTDQMDDLPARDASGKDEQVKGGRMKLNPDKPR